MVLTSPKSTHRIDSDEEILKIDLGSAKFCDLIVGKLSVIGIEVKDVNGPKSQRDDLVDSVPSSHSGKAKTLSQT